MKPHYENHVTTWLRPKRGTGSWPEALLRHWLRHSSVFDPAHSPRSRTLHSISSPPHTYGKTSRETQGREIHSLMNNSQLWLQAPANILRILASWRTCFIFSFQTPSFREEKRRKGDKQTLVVNPSCQISTSISKTASSRDHKKKAAVRLHVWYCRTN